MQSERRQDRTRSAATIHRRTPTDVRRVGRPSHCSKSSNLVKDLPGHRSVVLRRQVGSVSAIADVSFTVSDGETSAWSASPAAARRRSAGSIVGMEKADSGAIRIDGTELTSLHGQELRQQPAGHPADLPGRLCLARNPRMRVGAILAEPLVIHGVGNRACAPSGSATCSAEVGLPRARPTATRTSSPAVSGSASDWPEPLPCNRNLSSRTSRFRIGRLDPGADPEPDERPAAAARPDLRLHLARPVRGALPRQHDRRDVPGQTGRVGRPKPSTTGRTTRTRGA